MPDAIDPTGSHHDPRDAVLADYVQQVEAGVVPDREAQFAAHPEHAERLRDFFAGLDLLENQTGGLRQSPAE